MAARKKRGATTPRMQPAGGDTPPTATTTRRVKETATFIRRKNFDLDQRRLDEVRIALGAKTEREAISRAMDIALDVLAFEREVGAGSGALLGRGGFNYAFDDPEALDFSGFLADRNRGGAGSRGR
ncbi:MAG: hypothetical protein ACREOJ_19410 [Gemmatimonadaceae bacterium]